MKALVIFSGGQDSTTCLGWALKKYPEVEAITFKYGQKHSIEIQQAKKICDKHGVKQHIIDISFFGKIVDSALTSNGDVNKQHPMLVHLPASYVPNRNAMFITIAHALAQKIKADVLITGVCETDYSGYPDCRLVFVRSIERSLNSGADVSIKIKTPLMRLNKTQIWQLSKDVGIINDVIELSHTCYNGIRDKKFTWGYGCDNCPACKLRKQGFIQFNEQRND